MRYGTILSENDMLRLSRLAEMHVLTRIRNKNIEIIILFLI